MKKVNTAGALAGMIIMGLLAFAALAWLVEHRVKAPVLQSRAPLLTPTGAEDSLELLRQGLLTTLHSAAAALESGNQSRAAAAMDAARRAAQVGDEAGGMPFAGAHRSVDNARLQLQDGNLEGARALLQEASRHLRDFQGDYGAVAGAKQSLEDFRGATVLNKFGERIGEVGPIAGSRITLFLGGHRDILGFIDWTDGRRLVVSPGHLVIGSPKTLGSTMVVYPSYSSR